MARETEKLLGLVFSKQYVPRLHSKSVNKVKLLLWASKDVSVEAEENIVANRYQANTGDEIQDLYYSTAICRMLSSTELLQLPVVTIHEPSTNPTINPNPMSSHQPVTIFWTDYA
jgi:hypothetical protein